MSSTVSNDVICQVLLCCNAERIGATAISFCTKEKLGKLAAERVEAEVTTTHPATYQHAGRCSDIGAATRMPGHNYFWYAMGLVGIGWWLLKCSNVCAC
mgnify:CR=1 FL=1